MTHGEAEGLVGLMKGAWNMYLDDYGMTAWTDFFQDQDFKMATQAYTKLRDSQPERPTIADMRKMIIKLEVDRRMAQPAIEEAEFVREVEPWVVAWAVARYRHGDMRVLPQQKRGYDALQTANPYQRTYVWPDQELMDDEAVSAYVAAGTGLSVDDVFRAIGI
jgi:hypothetical protein